MYDYLIDQAQARREQIWAEIKQDRLIGQTQRTTNKSKKGVSKMQFNRQKVAAFLTEIFSFFSMRLCDLRSYYEDI